MEKSAALAMVMLLVLINRAVAATAPLIVYKETVDVYDVLDGRLPGPPAAQWRHTYDTSPLPIDTATLTIVAEGVDSPDEFDPVWFEGNFLGNLNQQGFVNDTYDINPGPGAIGFPVTELTTTVFDLDPSWITAMTTVTVKVAAIWIVEIETSTLTVTHIPEPTTVLLLGLGGLGLLRHRRSAAVGSG